MKNMSEELTLENDGESKAATNADAAELIRKCDKLLSLTGFTQLTVMDAIIVRDILNQAANASERDQMLINGLYQQREREAALRGEKWEVLP
jgi:hypothetical protein